MDRWLIGGVVVVVLVLLVAAVTGAAYKRLESLEEGVGVEWAQVDAAYGQRAKLASDLVQTLRTAGQAESPSLQEVVKACAGIGEVQISGLPTAGSLERYESVQERLSSALAGLLATVKGAPDIEAAEGVRTLQAQLDEVESRIAMGRRRYDRAARSFNRVRTTFPNAFIARLFGFQPRPYFEEETAAEGPPRAFRELAQVVGTHCARGRAQAVGVNEPA